MEVDLDPPSDGDDHPGESFVLLHMSEASVYAV